MSPINHLSRENRKAEVRRRALSHPTPRVETLCLHHLNRLLLLAKVLGK